MAHYNYAIHAAVTVTFTEGTNPAIAIDPTSSLPMAFNVTSVERKVGEATGVYTVTLANPIGAMTMDPRITVWCETASKGASVHPVIDGDGLVQVIEVQGYYTQGMNMGDLVDIMFILHINNQWMSS